MKRIILWISVFLIIIAISIFIAGIVVLNKKSIVGRWEAKDSDYQYYYVFDKDNKCFYEMIGAKLECSYELNNDELIIIYKGSDRKYSFKYRFEDDNLVIKDNTGNDNIFIRI